MRELLPNMRLIGARLSAQRPEPEPTDTPKARVPRPLPSVPPLRTRVEIPICDPAPDAEACASLRQRGQFLARQEDWETLAQEIETADNARQLTPGLRGVAALLCEGARSDVRAAIVQASARQNAAEGLAAFEALETVLEDLPDCPAFASVLALAHVDAAKVWRGARSLADLPENRRACFDHHMAAATALSDRYDPFQHGSALWAQVRCLVLDADPNPRERVTDDYEDLIDLDPGNPGHFRDLGRELRPARFGNWDLLDQQARRTAAQTADVWGVGGYTWVYFGVLSADSGAFRRLDAELFAEGLHDILSRRPTQEMANLLAALTGFTLGSASMNGSAHRRLAECFGWIAQDHLREIHPRIWAEAACPRHDPDAEPEDRDLVKRGRMRALSSLTQFYAPALDAGRRLVFDADGMRMVKDD
ncbi:hypothetical protein [Antarctobacter jejuensis]|uniref:hypothetical protein n=1 Tax=Antarctobacter jejuensis TaxID=1439938 RepID=UPI003FCFFE51